jgi:hypothetical protein
MSKVWVLDTSTKGTGAEMVPLEKVLREPGPGGQPLYVPPKPRARPPAPPAPRPPRRFKVVDVMTRRVLADGADARATLRLLGRLRSVVDVRISVWDEALARWEPLSLAEQKAVWELRGRAAA